jgi:thioredoxin-related protein
MGAGSSLPKSRTSNIIDQSGLAEKLSNKKPLVLVFVSPNCSLCAAIALKISNVGATQQITDRHSITCPALRHLISSAPHFSLYRPLTIRIVQL